MFECDECSMSFDTERGMKTHRGRVHKGEEEDIRYDPEELERLYWDEGLSQYEIAEITGTTQSSIGHSMRKFGISRRDDTFDGEICNDPEKLERLYWDEELSTRDIAEMDGCSKSTVQKNLDNFNILKRSPHAPSVEKEIVNDPNKLEELYLIEKLSMKKIAEKAECSRGTVSSRLDDFNIPKREPGRMKGPIKKHARYGTQKTGYREWKGYRGEWYEFVLVHQLLACMDHDPHDVFDPSTHVHHGSDGHDRLPPVELPFANWEGNLKVMDASEHHSYHGNKPRFIPNLNTLGKGNSEELKSVFAF